ncbi:MAG TPA: hypothetical protein VH475_06710 [Tepidisphaeraceae bacterium]|jgi:hypothetical protein
MANALGILERVIAPQRGGMSSELARHVLGLEFSESDHARYGELSAKARDGTLNTDERAELEEFLMVNNLLAILKSKARVSLRQHNPAA